MIYLEILSRTIIISSVRDVEEKLTLEKFSHLDRSLAVGEHWVQVVCQSLHPLHRSVSMRILYTVSYTSV